MELLERDYLMVLDKDDEIRNAFLKAAEHGLAFPFLPLFRSTAEMFFRTSFFVSSVLGFFSSHYILGFEGKIMGRRVKYGGMVHATNVGINMVTIFFGAERRRILGEVSEFMFWPVEVERIFVRLIPRMCVIFGTLRSRADVIRMHEIKGHPKFIVTGTQEKRALFLVPSRPSEVAKPGCFEFAEVPGEHEKVLEMVPCDSEIRNYPPKVFRECDVWSLIEQNRNSVLIIDENYIVHLYVGI